MIKIARAGEESSNGPAADPKQWLLPPAGFEDATEEEIEIGNSIGQMVTALLANKRLYSAYKADLTAAERQGDQRSARRILGACSRMIRNRQQTFLALKTVFQERCPSTLRALPTEDAER